MDWEGICLRSETDLPNEVKSKARSKAADKSVRATRNQPTGCNSLAVDDKNRIFCWSTTGKLQVFTSGGAELGSIDAPISYVGGTGDRIYAVGINGRLYQISAD
jgi:sugar lactone lactonase YvrE